MDSITQFALGAAIGEIAAGKKAGNKAVLWGGIAGTIPDLDVLTSPLFTDLQKLSVHRGFSHSLIFAFLLAPILARCVWWIYRNKCDAGYRNWLFLFFFGIFTHPLLDAFTLYGTQLFLPFSNYRAALNTISIVDPLYTLPLLFCTGGAMYIRRQDKDRAIKRAWYGIAISSMYLFITCCNKQWMDHRFENAMKKAGIPAENWLSNPVLFSNLLWYTVVREDSVCHIGYLSVFQKNDNILFESFPRKTELEANIKDKSGLDQLKWFSKDFYLMDLQNDTLCFYDIRFGKTNFNNVKDPEKTFVFYFRIPDPERSPLTIQQYVSRKDADFSMMTAQIKDRIFNTD